MRPIQVVAVLLVECLVQIVESSERGHLPTISDLLELSQRTGIPAFPSPGQRCIGRGNGFYGVVPYTRQFMRHIIEGYAFYYGSLNLGQRCCTPQDPCGEGEGDCDGPLDGAAVHDGHRGCKVNTQKRK